ncbi:hypothetical protein GGR58DRAFT_498957 [Xylaria digitata]|nr:hypothetical protein GGR58DRAFT_498957 [Xylaria digitata]
MYNRRENDNESSGINRSALEFAALRSLAVHSSSPLSSVREGDCHHITLKRNKSAENYSLQLASENEGERLAEDYRIVDERRSCCAAWGCSYIHGRGKEGYDASFSDREGFDWNSPSSCNCSCCCCEGNYGLYYVQDDGDNDSVIEFEIGHVLSLVKRWLATAMNWEKLAYFRLIMGLGSGQQRDEEVD